MDMKRVTYLIGAGASAEALPVVFGLPKRFKFFIDLMNNTSISGGLHPDTMGDLNYVLRNIENHSTVDTYAKKLFLQNPDLRANKEYDRLLNSLSCYFIYEQLKKDKTVKENAVLNREFYKERPDFDFLNAIHNDLDKRYDTFFATVLTHDRSTNQLILPKEINIISWNYDSQFEKAYMNYSGMSYDDSLDALNFIGLKDGEKVRVNQSSFIKLNGTAGFFTDKDKFGDLFDYSAHEMNEETVGIFKKILSSGRSEYKNSLRFAWVESDCSKYAIQAAIDVLKNSDIIVIIGYSFPYFNREVDRKIFSGVSVHTKGMIRTQTDSFSKIYIQAPTNSIKSISKRFEAIKPNSIVEEVTEVDQFLIPNEM